MAQEGFLTDIWTAMLFFRVCRRYKIEAQEDRVLLLRRLTARGKAQYLRDVEAATSGKKVLDLTNKRSHNAN